MNYNIVKTFAKKMLIALILVSLGKFFLAGHCAVVGLPLVFIGDYRMVAAVVSLLGDNFFSNMSSRARRFMEEVKEKADQLEH